ncbi:hypothetical protein ACIBRY_12035 [Streptomyces anulatus]
MTRARPRVACLDPRRSAGESVADPLRAAGENDEGRIRDRVGEPLERVQLAAARRTARKELARA